MISSPSSNFSSKSDVLYTYNFTSKIFNETVGTEAIGTLQRIKASAKLAIKEKSLYLALGFSGAKAETSSKRPGAVVVHRDQD
ncbi:MAG: hypothetical protein Q8935_09140 [Bacillota bacterium]|nr:hypothetical protein [Bacillota bacterium]